MPNELKTFRIWGWLFDHQSLEWYPNEDYVKAGNEEEALTIWEERYQDSYGKAYNVVESENTL
jgi:hypothetical protein